MVINQQTSRSETISTRQTSAKEEQHSHYTTLFFHFFYWTETEHFLVLRFTPLVCGRVISRRIMKTIRTAVARFRREKNIHFTFPPVLPLTQTACFKCNK
jgi:hypothetical protein